MINTNNVKSLFRDLAFWLFLFGVIFIFTSLRMRKDEAAADRCDQIELRCSEGSNPACDRFKIECLKED